MLKENDEFKAEYKKAKRKIYFKYIAISVAVSAVLTAVVFFVVFHGYNVLQDTFRSITLPVPVTLVWSFLAGKLLLSMGFIILFAKADIKSLLEDQFTKKAEKRLRKEIQEFVGESKTAPAGVFFIICGLVGIFLLSTQSFGVNGDKIRFGDSHRLNIVTAEFSDFTLYKLEGYRDDNNTIHNYKNAYGIVDSKGRNYEFGNVNDDFEKQLLEKYGGKYETAESIDQAINLEKGIS